jgi:hypothetical protein
MNENTEQTSRKTLSPEHMAKLQDAREKAASRRRDEKQMSRQRAEAPARRIDPEQIPRDVKDRPARAERRAFGGMQLKLAAAERPGYHRCWMNDEGNTLQEAEAAWYNYVTEHESSTGEGSKVRKLVGTKEGGAPLYAYLMEIEQDLWEQDQAIIEKRAHEVNASIGKVSQDGLRAADRGNFYGDVKITRR